MLPSMDEKTKETTLISEGISGKMGRIYNKLEVKFMELLV